MKIYDFLRIQNRDILFMTSLKVNISNLKKTFKILYTKYFRVSRELFESSYEFSTRLDSLTFRVEIEFESSLLESSFDRVEFE